MNPDSRDRILCCLKRVGQCKKRLEKNDRKYKIGLGSLRSTFDEFVGQRAPDFNENDIICSKHFAQFRNKNESFKSQQKRIASDVLPGPSSKQLRGREIQVKENPTSASTSSNLRQSASIPQIQHSASHMSGQSQDDISNQSQNDISLFDDDLPPPLPTSIADSHSVPDSQMSQMSIQVSQKFSIVPSTQNSQTDLSQESIIASSTTSSSASVITFKHIQGTKSTQSKCFICESFSGRKSVPWSAIRQAWFKLNFYIPKTNRVCDMHLDENNLFTEDSLHQIEAFKQGIKVTSMELGLWLHEVSDIKHTNPYDFNEGGVDPSKYEMLLGLKKEYFDELASYLDDKMRNTTARSKRNALAMFLFLFRNNSKQELIADMHGTSQQVVSNAIDSVSQILDEEFVPKYLGYHHITREEALEKHCRKLTSRTLGQPLDRLGAVADDTYNYIEQPSDFEMQRLTFSLHKMRNLVKLLIMCLPDGYILAVDGMYFCDSKNNDAANIRHHYKHSDALLFFDEDDFLVLDRGYRDVVEETKRNKVQVFMPSLLDKKRQKFTTEEANSSRRVTMNRHVIEQVNGRIKNVFPFFKHTIEATYIPKLIRFNRIACAILNAFFPPLIKETEFHSLVADIVENHDSTSNHLKEEIEALGITRMTNSWERATGESVLDFPKLTWDDLKRLTLGTYQLKMAKRYNKQHLKQDPRYAIFLYRHSDSLLRAKIDSRFRKSQSHYLWIKFTPDMNGFDGLDGLYCTCKVGERTLGCCSHLAAVCLYLGYERHQPIQPQQRRQQPWGVINCAEESDSDQDEESNSDGDSDD